MAGVMRAVGAGDAGFWRLLACYAQILRERISQLVGADVPTLAKCRCATGSMRSLDDNGRRHSPREQRSNLNRPGY